MRFFATVVLALVLVVGGFAAVSETPTATAASCDAFGRMYTSGYGYASAYCSSGTTLTACVQTTSVIAACRSVNIAGGTSRTVYTGTMCSTFTRPMRVYFYWNGGSGVSSWVQAGPSC